MRTSLWAGSALIWTHQRF